MAKKSKFIVLIADDDEQFRISLSKIFVKNGYEVKSAANGIEACQLIKQKSFDLVIADLMMPGKNGIELTREIKKECESAQVIIITAFGEQASKTAALEAGAFSYLNKPIKRDEILTCAAQALQSKAG
ncbi:response regulator [candidate division KSB1 bacterium]|nr:response regulator [candidate division KSB1 bacterium]